MLTQVHRPITFKEVAGNEVPKMVLRAIASNPSEAPRSIILAGGYGTGKTTTARIFARALNCTELVGDCCNTCKPCKETFDGSTRYVEFDSAIIGNVDTIRSLRDSFGYSLTNGYRVIVFDESHLVSRQAQSALLKVLEENTSKTFFVFPTTDPQDILPTIVSRAITLNFEPLPEQLLVKNLFTIAEKEGIPLDKETASIIARRTHGHVRDSLQQLELLKLMGQETFNDSVVVLDTLIGELMTALESADMDSARALIQTICSQPVEHIRQDFDIFVKDVATKLFIDNEADKTMKAMVFFYLKNQQYLRRSNDWYIFLSSLTGVFAKKAVIPSKSRFER